MQPVVSIIIPVYNTEKYLDDCIQSVLKQNFADFELLLINDGSKDNSGTICDKYAEKDARIKVFHKKNGGVSAARNLGLENAQGEWITFIDSDDWVNEKYLDCFNIDNIQNVDLIFLGLESKQYKYNSFDVANYKTILLKEIIPYFQPHGVGVGFKIFKNSIIKQHNIQFDHKFSQGEDTLFNINYFCYTKKIYLYFDAIYYYREDVANSLSKIKVNSYNKIEEYFYETKIASELFADKKIESVFLSSAMDMLINYMGANESHKENNLKIKKLIKKHPQTIKYIFRNSYKRYLIGLFTFIRFDLFFSFIFFKKIKFWTKKQPK